MLAPRWKIEVEAAAKTIKSVSDVTPKMLVELADKHGVLVEQILSVMAECPSCHGSGECPECEGSGKCRVCEGNGETQCEECGSDVECRHCDWTGKCPDCEGKKKCRECRGTGSRWPQAA